MTANARSLVADPRDNRVNVELVRDALCRADDSTAQIDTQAAAEPLPEPVEGPTRPAPDPAPAAGPSARLVALPQPDMGQQLMTPEGVDDHLSQLEAARQAQLDALPPIPRDVVAAAHRGTVTRILDQVRTARQRLSEGLYGVCAGCGTWIQRERLELRPWLITCTGCASPRP